MSRLPTFRLETNRLALSHLSHDDCEFILGLVNEPAFKRYIGDRQVHNLEDARAYLQKGAIGSYGQHGFGLYRVGLKPEGTPLGICGLVKREEFEHPDLGFAFREQYWENGYAYESCMATIEHARRDLGLEQIIAIVDGDNDSSIRLLRKLGFRFAEMIRMPGESKDICRYAFDL